MNVADVAVAVVAGAAAVAKAEIVHRTVKPW